MKQKLVRDGWRLTLGSPIALGMLALVGNSTLVRANVMPDDTLGNERSTVTPINAQKEQIHGGAVRGSNLFHSFRAFSVPENFTVEFSNPTGIRNIFSRVTGNTRSDILGTLGVAGNANLFFINPNGILFGSNARLDIRGSFTASTASSITLPDGTQFSARNPAAPPLLVVDVVAPVGLQFEGQPGVITNRGNLSAGQDLTFAAGNLDLQGQLQAGQNLTLQAQDAIQARDRADQPFIAAAGRQLLVQGNQSIDLFALNHPGSGLFSGGDMVLKSPTPVGGDAHYLTGGNFRIEQLNGNPGTLFSPYGSVIRANGDVSLGSYEGASLHIFTGGRVSIPGEILITGINSSANSIAETVTLSDGSTIELNGSVYPTLDIRAGTTSVGSPFVNTGATTGADITIGDVIFDEIGSDGGRVFLTNQYQPNQLLASGDITLGSIITGDTFGSGSVTIDSRKGVILNGNIDVSSLDLTPFEDFSTYFENGGNVKILANGDTTLTSGSSILSNGLNGGNVSINTGSFSMADGLITSDAVEAEGDAGSVTIKAREVVELNAVGIFSSGGFENGSGGKIEIDAGSLSIGNGSVLSNEAFGDGNAGNFIINVRDSISLDNTEINTSGGFGNSNGGNIKIAAGSLSIRNDSVLSSKAFGYGNAGNLIINARDSVLLDNTEINASSGSENSNGGNIKINADSLSMLNGSKLNATLSGQGKSGNIVISALNNVSLNNSNLSTEVLTNAIGEGGSIEITSGSLEITNGASLTTSTLGYGNAGNVIINAYNYIDLNNGRTRGGIFSSVGQTAIGNGGSIKINTNLLSLRNPEISRENYSFITTDTDGQGDAGSVIINARERILVEGSVISAVVRSNGKGDGGNIQINTNSLVSFFGGLLTGIEGEGVSGDVIVNANSSILFDGGGIFSNLGRDRTGSGGNIIINTAVLSVASGAQFFVSTEGKGDAGDIIINAHERVVVDGLDRKGNVNFAFSSIFSSAESSATGLGGTITITTPSLLVINSGVINARTQTSGRGGDIIVNADVLAIHDGGQLVTTTSSSGRAGNITVNAANNIILDGINSNYVEQKEQIAPQRKEDTQGEASGLYASAASNSSGNGGILTITTPQLIVQDGAKISAETSGSGLGGSLRITASDFVDLRRTNNLSPVLSVETSGAGRSGDITINTQTLRLSDQARITATATADSTNLQGGGSITLNASTMNLAGIVGVFAETQGVAPAGTLRLNPYGNQLDLNVTLTPSAKISASTSSSGNGGDLIVTAPRSITLDGPGQLAVEASSSGNAGNIWIATRNLTLKNGVNVSASTSGSGNGAGGDIGIMAEQLVLDNQSRITAETARSQGGNISLSISRLLLLRHNSLISTTAGTAQAGGDGGNITINNRDGFIVAVPKENSDITANAFTGRGGKVQVSTQNLFGIQFRPRLTPLSDITASSEQGVQGVVEINTPGIDPTGGLIELPEAPNSPKLSEGCEAGTGSGQSSFTNIGKGGLPSRPDEPLNADLFAAEWPSMAAESHTNPRSGSATPVKGDAIATNSSRWASPCQSN